MSLYQHHRSFAVSTSSLASVGSCCASPGPSTLALDADELVVAGCASILESWIQAPQTVSHTLGVFSSSSTPPIHMAQYLERLHQYMKCEINCFIAALTYVQRYLKNADTTESTEERDFMPLPLLDAHRLYFTALVIATKVLTEPTMTMDYYAAVGGVKLREANILELELLKALDFNATVDEVAYDAFQSIINKLGQE